MKKDKMTSEIEEILNSNITYIGDADKGISTVKKFEGMPVYWVGEKTKEQIAEELTNLIQQKQEEYLDEFVKFILETTTGSVLKDFEYEPCDCECEWESVVEKVKQFKEQKERI